jgi:hypothetical protein
MADGKPDMKGFASNLEDRLREKSDEVEQLHMEAAIDFEFCNLDSENDGSIDASQGKNEIGNLSNPHSVANSLSPYVPTKAQRIEKFISWVNLAGPSSGKKGDVLLDIGCGDGRVCVAASKISGKFGKAIYTFRKCLYILRSKLIIDSMES